jgi:Leucine-rich repeat (LRR) protein
VTLENLETFNADLNFVGGQLPDVFDKLLYLRSFDMAFNFLTGSLPPSLFYNASLLERLNLSGNALGNELPLPEGLGQMKALRILDLSINQFLGTIPGEISEMDSLKELRLDKNFLTGQLPTNFFVLSNIEILSLSENSLSVLPTLLIGLSKLRELQLSSNIIDELPEEYVNNFTNLGKLQEVNN